MTHTFPELRTKRLLLNQLMPTDIADITRYADNPNIAENLLNLPQPYTEFDATFWVNWANDGFKNADNFTFAIRLKEEQKFIGGIGLTLKKEHNRAELGYWLAEPFWGRGIMSEAASVILKFGFETLQINRIFAYHVLQNEASGKVMRNNGMIKEGELKDLTLKNGVYNSSALYRLTRQEFLALQNAEG